MRSQLLLAFGVMMFSIIGWCSLLSYSLLLLSSSTLDIIHRQYGSTGERRRRQLRSTSNWEDRGGPGGRSRYQSQRRALHEEYVSTVVDVDATVELEAQVAGASLSVGAFASHHRTRGSVVQDAGWKPSDYPNPIYDPVRCGISSLLNGLENDKTSRPLLLCDPDALLGQEYLKRIAISIRDFTLTIPNIHYSQCSSSSRVSGSTQHRAINSNAVNSTVELDDPNYFVPGSDLALGAEVNPPSLPTDDAQIQVAVAIVSKIDMQSVLRANSWYAYEDEDDVLNDATQYFSRYLFDNWRVASDSCGHLGILIFLSVQELSCYISTGGAIESVVPWWRMDYVVGDVKTDMKRQMNGDAILRAINDLRIFVEMGPPSMTDRIQDFVKRFGVVIGFAFFTFSFAIWGEYRDRFRRWQHTERRSKLSHSDKIRAMSLQEEYQCSHCPICLEEFPQSVKNKDSASQEGATGDSVPIIGSDGLPIKLLRCGHTFDYSCWKCWVDRGNGDPCKCPVCRQDIGGHTKRERSVATASTALSRSHNHPNYDSVTRSRSERNRRQREIAQHHSVSAWLLDNGSDEARDGMLDHRVVNETNVDLMIFGDEYRANVMEGTERGIR